MSYTRHGTLVMAGWTPPLEELVDQTISSMEMTLAE